MGTWSRNFAIPKADAAAVRQDFVNWMERRGFDLMERPPLLSLHKDDERIAFLFSNEKWTIIVYSEAFLEGDRILTELDDHPAVLEIWIGDSDHWGYALYEKGDFSAGCTLNKNYQESSSNPPASKADAEKVCKILGLENQARQVKKAQRKWHLFSDVPCKRFCEIIGVLPAVLPAKDIVGWNAGRLESCNVAGWQIDPLLFEKRKLFGSRDHEPVLHALAVRSFTPDEPRQQIDPEFVRQMQNRIKVMVWLFRPLGWILAAPFLISIRLEQLGISLPSRPIVGHEVLDAILVQTLPWSQDGSWQVNSRHGCRILVGKAVDEAKNPFISRGVFRFFAQGIEILCAAIRPEDVRMIFDFKPQYAVLTDENFFVGRFPGRILAYRAPEADASRYYYFWFIELPRAIYQFGHSDKVVMPQNAFDEITKVVKSFEVITEVQKSDLNTLG